MDKVVKTIPENLNLSEAEKSVLQKGLNVIPIKPTTDEFISKEDCEKFYRRLRLKAFFHDKDHDSSEQPIENPDQQNGEIVSETKKELVFEQLNPKQSTWVPPPGKFSSLDHYIQRCRTEIDQLDFRKRMRNQNLTREELTALKSHRHCRRHWLDWKKSCERKLHQRPQQQCHELCQIHRCHGWQRRFEAVS